jgi:hypothetical protein
VTTFTAFTANYDASGSENDRAGVLVVVGLVANEYKWLRFQEQWNDVLREFRVPYYHRRELGERHLGTGAYVKWKDDHQTPRQFTLKLIKVLRKQTQKQFIYGTVLDDFRFVDGQYRLREVLGSPYALTAGNCYESVNLWRRKNYSSGTCLHVFEDGDVGQKDFIKLAHRLGHRPQTRPKKDETTGELFVPFQGADLLAGAWHRAAGMRDRVKHFDDYGEEFNEIARTMARNAKLHNRETLLAWCKDNPQTCQRRT